MRTGPERSVRPDGRTRVMSGFPMDRTGFGIRRAARHKAGDRVHLVGLETRGLWLGAVARAVALAVAVLGLVVAFCLVLLVARASILGDDRSGGGAGSAGGGFRSVGGGSGIGLVDWGVKRGGWRLMSDCRRAGFGRWGCMSIRCGRGSTRGGGMRCGCRWAGNGRDRHRRRWSGAGSCRGACWPRGAGAAKWADEQDGAQRDGFGGGDERHDQPGRAGTGS